MIHLKASCIGHDIVCPAFVASADDAVSLYPHVHCYHECFSRRRSQGHDYNHDSCSDVHGACGAPPVQLLRQIDPYCTHIGGSALQGSDFQDRHFDNNYIVTVMGVFVFVGIS